MIAPPTRPPHDELEALFKEARARQLRRRLVGTAFVAVAGAIGLSIYASVSGILPAAKTQPARGGASAPLCRPSQLAGSTFLQAATMSGVGPATIANVSSHSCTLPPGVPSVRITWHGRTLPVEERALRGPEGPRVHLLRPGTKAAVPMQWINWCGQPRGMLRLTFYLRFRNGLEVRAPERRTGQPACVQASEPSVLSVGTPFRVE